MTWIQTYTLRAFDLLAPAPEMVDAEDIAHALSRLNRFSGHTHGEPYSVAHHSMLVADLLASWGAPPEVVREGLLHDAPEAYYGDLVSPLKMALRLSAAETWRCAADGGSSDEVTASILDPLGKVTVDIDRVVRKALLLPAEQTPIVKRADLVALAIERRDLFGDKPEPRDWELPEYAPTSAPCDRLHRPPIEWESAPPGRMHARRLVPWAEAKTRFLALLAELDAKRGST